MKESKNTDKFIEEVQTVLDKFEGSKMFDSVVDKLGDDVMALVEKYGLNIEIDKILEVESGVYNVVFRDSDKTNILNR